MIASNIVALPSPDGLDIALWLINLDHAPQAWNDAVLSEEEADRAARFRFEVHAHRYQASHVALRQILGQLTGQNPASLQFNTGSEGKPRLAQLGSPHFNLSHSAGWALIGTCASHPIGVDIEVIEPLNDAATLAQSHFTPSEQAAFLRTPAERQLAAFFGCWTRKEACLKALGSGLTIEPHTFEAGLDPQPRHTTIQVNDQACAMQVSSLIDLPVGGLAAAVAKLFDPRSPGLL
ncbi:4'-phosphopantetheinyl transferase superfamily protein [Aquabacterium sp.]|uniref:4'-phosphopantetheinyl transferase family protein n=1 Tax=Aquabacterium sp. TaxID=1872578 RepID=UPI00248776C4|nr:4'-phosphopantetheinyl transferase superfamily protein [Aquabacterium sp.]MDI1260258.1 4'-phosphopantetheinyl transferase superfamily protein [Aquabacterium sp.]